MVSGLVTPASASSRKALRAALVPAGSLSSATMTRRSVSGPMPSMVASCSAVSAVPRGATATSSQVVGGAAAAVTAWASMGPSTMTRSAPATEFLDVVGGEAVGQFGFAEQVGGGAVDVFRCGGVGVGGVFPADESDDRAVGVVDGQHDPVAEPVDQRCRGCRCGPGRRRAVRCW